MIVIQSYFVAVLMCVITMFCWGSWANTQKMASKKWAFQLFYWDYAIGVFLLSLVLAFTMGSIGTAVAMETADVVLLTDEIGQVPYLIELSQATMVNIRTNITVSMTIVLCSVAASALGIFGPVIGAIMHEVAAVPVIANAATLIGWKSKKL